MTDLTPIFDDILAKHSDREVERKPPRQLLEGLDSFSQEAYKVNSQIASLHAWLKNIRHSYLSSERPPKLALRHTGRTGEQRRAQRFTNHDREQIDVNAKVLMRELSARIKNMSVAEVIRHDTCQAVIQRKYRGPLGALGAWAAGGEFVGAGGRRLRESQEQRLAHDAEMAVATHHANVLEYLRKRLQDCMLTQTTMMEIRISREKEKQKSILATAGRLPPLDLPPGPEATTTRRAAVPEDVYHSAGRQPDGEPSSEQLQRFERQNRELMRQDESTLSQVRTAEQSLAEIAELQQELINNLSTQSEHINQLVTDSLQTTDNVSGGNKQLQQASEKPSTARRLFLSTTAFCAFLVVWDLLF